MHLWSTSAGQEPDIALYVVADPGKENMVVSTDFCQVLEPGGLRGKDQEYFPVFFFFFHRASSICLSGFNRCDFVLEKRVSIRPDLISLRPRKLVEHSSPLV